MTSWLLPETESMYNISLAREHQPRLYEHVVRISNVAPTYGFGYVLDNHEWRSERDTHGTHGLVMLLDP